MAAPPSFPVAENEAVLRRWVAELVGPGESVVSGELVLTDRQCAFVPARGFLRRPRGRSDATVRWRLEEVRTFSSRRFFLRIGYGDRIELGGVEINGTEFRLGRVTRPEEVLEAIQDARSRRPPARDGAADA